MNGFAARFFNGRQAGAGRAVVCAEEENGDLLLCGENGVEVIRCPAGTYFVEEELGRLPWRIRLADGGLLEVEREALPPDFALGHRRKGFLQRVHHWEASRWGWAAALLGVIGAVCLFYFIILPRAAYELAHKLPPELTASISEEVLALLDGRFFDPSELDGTRQEELRAGFARLAHRAGETTPHEVIFRSSRLGPNAFALPGGQILLTDELIEMADSDGEIYLVMAHELGHIHHRHGLRMVLQSTGLVVAAAFFLGDMSSVVQVAGAVPAMLIENGYSRKYEHEADEFAGHFGLASGLGVQPLVDFLTRLDREFGEDPLPWMSTHPATKERLERLRRMEP